MQVREFGKQATLDESLGEEDRAAELRKMINDTLSHEPLFHGAHRTPYRDIRGE